MRQVQKDSNEKEKLKNWIIKNSDFSGEKNGIVHGKHIWCYTFYDGTICFNLSNS